MFFQQEHLMLKRQSFQQLVLGELEFHVQKSEVGHLSNIMYKINSKLFHDLNERPKKIKLPEKNKMCQWLLGYDTRGTGNRRKNKQIGLYKN